MREKANRLQGTEQLSLFLPFGFHPWMGELSVRGVWGVCDFRFFFSFSGIV